MLVNIPYLHGAFGHDDANISVLQFSHLGLSRFCHSCMPPPPWALPDFSRERQMSTASARLKIKSHKECQIGCQNIPQTECRIDCQNMYQRKCQAECQKECWNIYIYARNTARQNVRELMYIYIYILIIIHNYIYIHTDIFWYFLKGQGRHLTLF